MPFPLPSLRALGSLWPPASRRVAQDEPPTQSSSRAEQSLRALLGGTNAKASKAAGELHNAPTSLRSRVEFSEPWLQIEAPCGASLGKLKPSGHAKTLPKPGSVSMQRPKTLRQPLRQMVTNHAAPTLGDLGGRHVEVAAAGLQAALRAYLRNLDGVALAQAVKHVLAKLDVAPDVAPLSKARLTLVGRCLQQVASHADGVALLRAQAVLDALD